jgi:hypothetical protein
VSALVAAFKLLGIAILADSRNERHLFTWRK